METSRPEQLVDAIRALPPGERLRVVELVVREVAAGLREPAGAAPPSSVIGLFADVPDLVDEVCESALVARERNPLRVS